jgi:hypothetical protein
MMFLHKYIRISLLVVAVCLLPIAAYADFNPTDPPEPYVTYQVIVGITPAEAGKTTGSGQYLVGDKATITAKPNKHYKLLYWTINGYAYSDTTDTFTYVVGDSAVTFLAHYKYEEPIPDPWVPTNPPEPYVTQHISVDLNPLVGGYTRGTGDYIAGTNVSIQALPYVNYALKYWTINGYDYPETKESFTYVVGDTCVHFVGHLVEKHLLTLKTYPRAAAISTMTMDGQPITDMLVAPDKEIHFTTIANTDYIFRYWTVNGYPHSTMPSYQYTMGDTTASVVAVYDYVGTGDTTMYNPVNPPEPALREDVTVLALSADESQGTVSGGGTYPFATIATLVATPINGSVFRYWHDGNKDATRVIRAERDTVYIAYFGNDTVTWNDTICSGQSIIWHGQTLTTGGEYIYKEPTDTLACGYITHKMNLYVRPELNMIFSDTALYYCGNGIEQQLSYTILAGYPSTYSLHLCSAHSDFTMQWLMQEMGEYITIPPLPENVWPDHYQLTIKVQDTYCGEYVYELPVYVSYHSDSIITQRWNDLLAVRQTAYDYYNGFSSYQWYCDGSPISGANQPIYYKPEGLGGSTYQVEVTRIQDGVKIRSCSYTPTVQPSTSTLIVQPTAVHPQENMQVIAPESGEISIVSHMGHLVSTFMVEQGKNIVKAPNTSGIYLVYLIDQIEKKHVQKLIVY